MTRFITVALIVTAGACLALAGSPAPSTLGAGARAPATAPATAPVGQKELVLKLGKDVTMRLVSIPAGTSRMGSPFDEEGHQGGEVRVQAKIAKPFYMGIYEVTQEQYLAVIGANPSKFKNAQNPVETVSWNDAVAFCAKLSEMTKQQVRLPSEAEWEYACRAGTTTPFNPGETIRSDQANYDARWAYGKGPKGYFYEKTTPVGSFKPNAWGLYDMHGNVLEWCGDTQGDRRMVRGGSWFTPPWECRAACRSKVDPADRSGDCGFRVVVVADTD